MITPKQQRLLNSIDPEIIDQLGLSPIPSPEYKYSRSVSSRVEEIWQELKNKTVVKRSAFMESWTNEPQIFKPQACITAYLTQLYGKQPWKTPLPHAPF